MKVLFVGDAVVDTGFSRCTHAVCDELSRRGHQVAVLGINYFGGPHRYPYAIYPCYDPTDGGRDMFGATRLPQLIDRLRPDVVVLLNDPWNVDFYMSQCESVLAKLGPDRPKFIGWMAVDSMNQNGEPLNKLDEVVVWTEFGKRQLMTGGYKGRVHLCGLGVDSSVFTMDGPIDKVLARLPPHISSRYHSDADVLSRPYIVGVVGRNQYRKRLDITLRAFADFAVDVPDSYLLIHTAPTGESSTDIESMASYYGITDKVILSMAPKIGHGVPDEYLAQLYRLFDVYLTTSQAEGWGLPAMEAMACGTRCVLPYFAAFGSEGWTTRAKTVIRYTAGEHIQSAPMNGAIHTIAAHGRVDAVVRALQEAYWCDRSEPEDARVVEGRFLRDDSVWASCRTWGVVGDEFVSTMEHVMMGPPV